MQGWAATLACKIISTTESTPVEMLLPARLDNEVMAYSFIFTVNGED